MGRVVSRKNVGVKGKVVATKKTGDSSASHKKMAWSGSAKFKKSPGASAGGLKRRK